MEKYTAGQYIQQDSRYKSFHPSPLNRSWTINDLDVIQLLGEANLYIGRLDMYSEYVPNLDLFIEAHIAKEATESSRIEGTETNIEEALASRENISKEKRDDWEEVQNYIKALHLGMEEMKQLPISTRLIKKIHAVLLSGVRGKHKKPGEYRKSQNWIGGRTIDNAIFVPPIHTALDECMSDLEKFIHYGEFPALLKIALVHYQFETIHPFLDGNGRVGRLLIILSLVEQGILKRPVLYLSDYFERNRMAYYQHLSRIREENDLTHWFKFFLTGIIETAQSGIETFDGILKLRAAIDETMSRRKKHVKTPKQLLEEFYKKPLMNAAELSMKTGLTKPTVNKGISALVEMGLLEETTGRERNKKYRFSPYLNLFT